MQNPRGLFAEKPYKIYIHILIVNPPIQYFLLHVNKQKA